LGNRLRRIQRGAHLFRGPPDEGADGVDGGARGGFESGNGGLGVGHLGLGAQHVEAGGQAGVELRLGQREPIALDGQILLRHRQLPLGAAQLDVVARHFGEQGQGDIAAILHRRLIGSLGGFDGAALATEEVDFPGGIEAYLVKIAALARTKAAGRHADGHVGAAVGAVIAGAGIGCGILRGAGDAALRPRLADTRLRFGEIGGGLQRLRHELVQGGVAEAFPPGAVRRLRCIGGGTLLELLGEAGRQRLLRRLVVGAHGAGTQQCAEQQDEPPAPAR